MDNSILNVSVIIPTYNRKNLLKRALHSASSQTFVPQEIIVVDDGSSDGTKNWVLEKKFNPKMQNSTRQSLIKGWTKAIKRALIISFLLCSCQTINFSLYLFIIVFLQVFKIIVVHTLFVFVCDPFRRIFYGVYFICY